MCVSSNHELDALSRHLTLAVAIHGSKFMAVSLINIVYCAQFAVCIGVCAVSAPVGISHNAIASDLQRLFSAGVYQWHCHSWRLSGAHIGRVRHGIS